MRALALVFVVACGGSVETLAERSVQDGEVLGSAAPYPGRDRWDLDNHRHSEPAESVRAGALDAGACVVVAIDGEDAQRCGERYPNGYDAYACPVDGAGRLLRRPEKKCLFLSRAELVCCEQ